MDDLHQDLLELQRIDDLGLTDVSDKLTVLSDNVEKLDKTIGFCSFALLFATCIIIGLIVFDILSKRWHT